MGAIRRLHHDAQAALQDEEHVGGYVVKMEGCFVRLRIDPMNSCEQHGQRFGQRSFKEGVFSQQVGQRGRGRRHDSTIALFRAKTERDETHSGRK